MVNHQLVLDKVYQFFIESSDFNGIPLSSLADETKIEYLKIIDIVKQLVIENKVSVQNGNNPHIISMCHYNLNSQIEILDEAKDNKTTTIELNVEAVRFISESYLVCVYPSEDYLKSKRNVSEFVNQPYTCQLALGEPQLKPIFFDTEVLDRYYRDPRYYFSFENYSGRISCNVDQDGNLFLPENDQVYIKSIGLGTDSFGNRVIVSFLRYLKDLPYEHQIFWKNKEINDNCSIYEEYYQNMIEGRWTNSISIFSGFIAEQKALNDLAKGIFGKCIFNDTYEGEKRHNGFTYFFLPTSKHYYDFVSLLDKMISDNINYKFFKHTNIELFDIEFKDGLHEKKQKGTLRLFQEWLTESYCPDKPNEVKELFKSWNIIRGERMNPAHKISENVYDKTYFKKQMQLINEAYRTMKELRMVFQSHPKAKNVELDKSLDKVEVKLF